MEIKEEEKTLVSYAQLRETPFDFNRLAVCFLADRSSLDKITPRTVTSESMNIAGYQVNLNDFVDFGQVNKAGGTKQRKLSAKPKEEQHGY